MTVESDKNTSIDKQCAEMLSIYYCRAKKSKPRTREIIRQEYLDYCRIYQMGAEHKDFNFLNNSIKNQIKSASILYLNNFDLIKKERRRIKFVKKHIDAACKISEINILIKMAYEATSRFPEEVTDPSE